MKTAFKPILQSSSIEHLEDGQVYQFPELQFSPNLSEIYSRVAILDKIVIKLPTSWGFFEYKTYVKREEKDGDEIRYLEEIEKYSNFNKLLTLYPSFTNTLNMDGKDKIHYLLIHKLQYDDY